MIEFALKMPHPDSFVIERKGLGHPDTLSDGIAEYASIKYSKYCLDNYGTVLHHNLDKTYISGGLATADFGRGYFSQPIKIHMNGRCSSSFAGSRIPVDEIFAAAADEYLTAVLPHCHPSSYVVVMNTTTYSHSDYWFNPRSLADVPDAIKPHANDTSYTVGYWPLTDREALLQKIEKALVEATRDKESPLAVGQDIKLMYYGTPYSPHLTLCIPTISQLTLNAVAYKNTLAAARETVNKILQDENIDNVNLQINAGDTKMDHEKYYMLTSGSCLEGGEEGVVGRGNNHLGIISSNRPHAMEGPSGKNPQYHVGKVQTFLAQRCAEAVYKTAGMANEVHIVSRIGDPIRSPDYVRVSCGAQVDQKLVADVISSTLADVQFRDALLAGWLLPTKGMLNIEGIPF